MTREIIKTNKYEMHIYLHTWLFTSEKRASSAQWIRGMVKPGQFKMANRRIPAAARNQAVYPANS